MDIGYIIEDIDCAPAPEYISFTSKPEIAPFGETIGDVNDDYFKRLQIRRTIEEHLDRRDPVALRDALRANGVCDPEAVAAWDDADIGNALKLAGYDRGGITFIIAPRLINPCGRPRRVSWTNYPDAASEGGRERLTAVLTAVKGFGPRAAKVAWELIGTGGEGGE